MKGREMRQTDIILSIHQKRGTEGRTIALSDLLESRVKRKFQARLRVQERLMYPAGVRHAGAKKIGSSVAGRAGRRETDGPEAPRQPHLEGECKWSGRNESEREVAPKVRSPGGRARNREGEGSTTRRKPIDAVGRSGGVVSDGTTTRIH
jgi:hypothetical protein